MAKTNASPAQNTVANNDVKTDLGITFQNVKTQSVNIGGTDFYYRKLFFNRNENGKKLAKEFLARLKERKENRDKKMSFSNLQRQLKAIHAWALQTSQDLSVIKQPVLVANGDNDRMVPSSNTYDLGKRIPNSELIIYKDAGHGGMYQYHEAFVKSALAFSAK